MRFTRQVDIAAPPDEVFAFHQRPDAYALLQPPWEANEILVPPRSLEPGVRVLLRTRVGPFPMLVESEHVLLDPARRVFADRMIRGPFRAWYHEHRVEAAASGARLIDDITCTLPLGRLGDLVAGASVRRRLERLFDYRHAMTRLVCEGQTPGEARQAILATGKPFTPPPR